MYIYQNSIELFLNEILASQNQRMLVYYIENMSMDIAILESFLFYNFSRVIYTFKESIAYIPRNMELMHAFDSINKNVQVWGDKFFKYIAIH